MKKSFSALLIAASLMLVNTAAIAGVSCPAYPQNERLDPQAFQKTLTQQGYKIKNFKVSGNCYEIYGMDSKGKKVEIYFDMKTGKPVKSK